FIPHIFDKNNTALFLWPMISVLGHRSEGTDTGLGPFRRGWAREQAKASSHGCGVVRNVCCDVSALSGAVFKSSAAPLPTPKLAAPQFAKTRPKINAESLTKERVGARLHGANPVRKVVRNGRDQRRSRRILE